jgi:hypothetical protein
MTVYDPVVGGFLVLGNKIQKTSHQKTAGRGEKK